MYKQDNIVESKTTPIRTEELLKGGIITFSTDVNALELSADKIVNFIKLRFTTLKQRLTKASKVKNILTDNGMYFFSLGNFFYGNYQTETPNGIMYFSENSKSIKIAGIDSELLGEVALAIAREFVQESVLVTDLDKNETYLVCAD